MQNSRLSLIPSTIASPDGASSVTIPPAWVSRVEPQLFNEEKVLAWFETDLSAQLYFTAGFIAVTNKRLLAATEKEGVWQGWFFRPGVAFVPQDHSGVSSPGLPDENSPLARWRYTLGNDVLVGRL